MTQDEYNRELAAAKARGDWAGVAWLTNYMNPSASRLGMLGFQTLGFQRDPGTFKGIPALPATAPEGQLYLYPNGGLSNIAGPGASAPMAAADAYSRAAAAQLGTPVGSTTFTPSVASQGTTMASTPLTTAAANLANATKPTVPQFIQPYQKPSGVGAFGESDIF